MMSKSSTITDRGDWLHNAHAGELLLSEFLEPLEMSPEQLADAIDVPLARIIPVIEGALPIDAELDLRFYVVKSFGPSSSFTGALASQWHTNYRFAFRSISARTSGSG